MAELGFGGDSAAGCALGLARRGGATAAPWRVLQQAAGLARSGLSCYSRMQCGYTYVRARPYMLACLRARARRRRLVLQQTARVKSSSRTERA